MRVLITGSNRGIGLAYVQQLLARGDTVYAASRQPEQAADLQALTATYDDQLILVQMDVADADSVAAAGAAVQQHTDALDLLINNAGVNPDEGGLGDLQKDQLLWVLEVNVAGVMLVTQQFTDLLAAGANPRVVHISSGAGSLAQASAGMLSYRVSKAALNMLHRVLDFDLRERGITTLALNPGWVATDMGGADASLQPDESVRQQLQVINAMTLAESGAFKNYDGSTLPW